MLRLGVVQQQAKGTVELMNKKFGEGWNCIIGDGYDFEVTHMKNQMIFVYYGKLACLLYKY